MRRRLGSALLVLALGTGLLGATPLTALGQAACAAPPPMQFAPQRIIDDSRAGGEPMIHTHPDGTLLYGSHAGTTHFFGPAAADADTLAFLENYQGQTYSYYSTDNGTTWNFVPRLPGTGGVNAPASGFSDPDYAIDTAGNVYLSEINLANVAVSRSTNSGRTFTLQNFFALTVSDRQWKEADTPGRVYMVANAFGGGSSTRPVGDLSHNLYVSSDGGATFAAGRPNAGGLGDIRVDQSDGTLYEANYTGNTLRMSSFRGARANDFTRTQSTIATNVRMLGHWPTFHLDPQGNLYITWDESGTGDRPAGVYFAYSTDRARTWSAPVRLDTGPQTDIWPWLAVGDQGQVAVAWLGNDAMIPAHDAEAATEPWHLYVAQSTSGVGCASSSTPTFTTTKATTTPVHTGTICQGGTVCQAQAIDRRLGDYFSTEVDDTGAFVIAYSDTSRGGSVSLPGFIRQSGGQPLIGAQVDPVIPEAPTALLLPVAAALGLAGLLLRRRTRLPV